MVRPFIAGTFLMVLGGAVAVIPYTLGWPGARYYGVGGIVIIVVGFVFQAVAAYANRPSTWDKLPPRR